MMVFGDKVNYRRETVKEYLKEYRINEYDNLNKKDFLKWLNKLDENVEISISVYEESEGFEYGHNVISFEPYLERLENDKEYKERIAEEEEEYEKLCERERLKKNAHEEYLKDLEEYKRIQEKYHFR